LTGIINKINDATGMELLESLSTSNAVQVQVHYASWRCSGTFCSPCAFGKKAGLMGRIRGEVDKYIPEFYIQLTASSTSSHFLEKL
jgi:hypothetical protein